MKLSRAWAMPSAQTFTIKPIAELLERYDVGIGWIDPFANENSPAEITNDINEKFDTEFNLDAKEFLALMPLKSKVGALFDPPYSHRQVLEMYEGRRMKKASVVRDLLSKAIKVGGICISFGWSSNGLGVKRDFKIEEILLVAHGGDHNDTIVTVERKVSHQERLF